MKLGRFTASLALLAAACASSETTTQAAPTSPCRPPPPRRQKDPNAMVCKNKKEMGSNVPVRTCLTHVQWDA
jgi:hypothetical protein